MKLHIWPTPWRAVLTGSFNSEAAAKQQHITVRTVHSLESCITDVRHPFNNSTLTASPYFMYFKL
jgi:hypothetical protein